MDGLRFRRGDVESRHQVLKVPLDLQRLRRVADCGEDVGYLPLETESCLQLGKKHVHSAPDVAKRIVDSDNRKAERNCSRRQ